MQVPGPGMAGGPGGPPAAGGAPGARPPAPANPHDRPMVSFFDPDNSQWGWVTPEQAAKLQGQGGSRWEFQGVVNPAPSRQRLQAAFSAGASRGKWSGSEQEAAAFGLGNRYYDAQEGIARNQRRAQAATDPLVHDRWMELVQQAQQQSAAIQEQFQQMLMAVPALQHGGRITRPGTVMVGEGGRPELLKLPRGAEVEPLDRGSVMKGGPRGVAPLKDWREATRGPTGIPNWDENLKKDRDGRRAPTLPERVRDGGRAMGSGISPMSLVVHYNQNAPVYGYLDFDRQVNEAVKKSV